MSSTPQDKSWSPRTQKIILWSFGFVVLAALTYWNYATFAGGFWSAIPDSPDCIRTKAVVTQVDETGTTTRTTLENYYITYKYTVEGKSIENHERVTLNVFNRAELNEEIEVCYMKDHPDRVTVIGNDVDGENYFIVFVSDIAFLFFIGMIIRHRIRERKKAAKSVT